MHNVWPVTPRFFATLLLGPVLLVACGGEETRPATWSYISPAIIQPNCATSSCHNAGAAVAGLDLSTADSGYADLMEQKLAPVEGKPLREEAPRQMIVPGNPEQSRVVNMLRAIGAYRMPPDRPLAEADIRLIEEWILLGAEKE